MRVKYWEIIADNLSKAGWSWGRVSAVDSHGRTIFVADAHRGDGQRLLCERMKSWSRFSNLKESRIMTVIEIKPHRNGWKVFEAPGVEPVFPEKRQAISYADSRACFRSGEIRILDSSGNIVSGKGPG